MAKMTDDEAQAAVDGLRLLARYFRRLGRDLSAVFDVLAPKPPMMGGVGPAGGIDVTQMIPPMHLNAHDQQWLDFQQLLPPLAPLDLCRALMLTREQLGEPADSNADYGRRYTSLHSEQRKG